MAVNGSNPQLSRMSVEVLTLTELGPEWIRETGISPLSHGHSISLSLIYLMGMKIGCQGHIKNFAVLQGFHILFGRAAAE